MHQLSSQAKTSLVFTGLILTPYTESMFHYFIEHEIHSGYFLTASGQKREYAGNSISSKVFVVIHFTFLYFQLFPIGY